MTPKLRASEKCTSEQQHGVISLLQGLEQQRSAQANSSTELSHDSQAQSSREVHNRTAARSYLMTPRLRVAEKCTIEQQHGVIS